MSIKDDMLDAIAKQRQILGADFGPGQYVASVSSGYAVSPERMVALRLRIKEGQKIPFEFFQAYLSERVAVVFIVKDNKWIAIDDDPALFPSDKLITELRLLIG